MLETGNVCPKFNLTPLVTHPKHPDLLLMQILVHYVAGIPPPGTTVLYFNFKSGDIVWSSLTGCCMNLVAYILHECSSVAKIDWICLFIPTKQSCWLYSQTRDQKTGSCCCRASEIGNKVLIKGELALVMKAESQMHRHRPVWKCIGKLEPRQLWVLLEDNTLPLRGTG